MSVLEEEAVALDRLARDRNAIIVLGALCDLYVGESVRRRDVEALCPNLRPWAGERAMLRLKRLGLAAPRGCGWEPTNAGLRWSAWRRMKFSA